MKTYSRKRAGDNAAVIINLNELCRLCLSKDDELIPIFNEEDPVPLTLRIMACVSLEVFEGDGLPNMICHACKFQLEKSYMFKKKCESSDLRLRRHLKLIQEKLCAPANGKQDVSQLLADLMSEVPEAVDATAEEAGSNDDDAADDDVELPSSEQELVGARVAYLQSDHDQTEDGADGAEDITLPLAPDDDLTKDACTLKRELDPLDSTGIFLMDDGVGGSEPQPHIIDQSDFGAIAEAVKQTLASQPGLNLSGHLQIKLDHTAEHPTQVQVTTEDGSVILMELITEEDVNSSGEAGERQQQDNGVPSAPSPLLEQDDNEEYKVFACPDCPKSFSRRIQLRRHASVHMQQRGYSCGLCEKWFPTRSALIRHERIHTGERPFKCDVCLKCFAQKEILYRHLMTHTGEKPYKCPHCGKGFTQREPLRVHLRSHAARPGPADIQLHHCTLCPKVFCHASGLSRHLVAHTGRTFKCRDCDKAFTDKSSLRRHHKLVNHQP